MKYNIVFNSQTGTPVTSTFHNNVNYTFDFQTIPDGEYEATFTYTGYENDLRISASHDYKPAMVFMNIGKANDFLAGNSTGTNYLSSNFMGFLEPNRSEEFGFLYSKHLDNQPVYINRPSSNIVNIQVRDPAGALYLDSGGGQLNSYVIVLHLEMKKRYKKSISLETLKVDENEYEEIEVEEEYELPKNFVSS